MNDALGDAIASLEEFLRKYPSGHFTEVAQARLNRLLAERGERPVTPIAPAGNPFGKGIAQASTAYSVGDYYKFRTLDGYTGSETSSVTQRVTQVSVIDVTYDDGRSITDLLGNIILRPDGIRLVDTQHYAAEYFVGKKWRTRYGVTFRDGRRDETTIDYVVAGREDIVVPAGRFDAFRIEGEGFQFAAGRRHFVNWVAPHQVRRAVARDLARWDSRLGSTAPSRERIELVAFSEKVPPGRSPAV